MISPIKMGLEREPVFPPYRICRPYGVISGERNQFMSSK